MGDSCTMLPKETLKKAGAAMDEYKDGDGKMDDPQNVDECAAACNAKDTCVAAQIGIPNKAGSTTEFEEKGFCYLKEASDTLDKEKLREDTWSGGKNAACVKGLTGNGRTR